MNKPAFSPLAQTKPIKVQLIDDSAVVRGLTRRWLSGHADIALDIISYDGAQGVKDAAEHLPDVIILDVEMPRMDGLEALPHLRRAAPKAKILMASTLTHKGATTTIRALSLGASDYLPKPEAGQLGGAEAYRDALLEKIRLFGKPENARAPALPAKPLPPLARPFQQSEAPARPVAGRSVAPRKPAGAGDVLGKGLRPLPLTHVRPDAIVVASSTGGPQALQTFLPAISQKTNLPILIVQHMPATFTKILAEHLNASCKHTVQEGEAGMKVEANNIYIAPGDYHMTVDRKNGESTLNLNQGPQVSFCRPAADVLFKSARETYGGNLAVVVLTGMGSDGCAGVGSILEKGGRIFVQDQESSVVWGMPGSVFNAGYAHSLHALNDLAPAVEKYLSGGR